MNIHYYIMEIFLSFGLFFQLLFGSIYVKKTKETYLDINKELLKQSVIIFTVLIFGYLALYIDTYSWSIVTNSFILISKLVVSVVAFMLIFFFPEALQTQKIKFYEYYSIYFVALLALLLMLDCNDLIMFYLVMETQALCFYVLASINRGNIFSVEAGLKYFVVGAFISSLYLLGAILIYGSLGTLNLIEIYEYSCNYFYCSSDLNFLTGIGVVLILCTLLFKMAAFPFHFWMVDVYEGAPLVSTLVFSILPKFSLTYFFIKFCISFGFLNYFYRDILIIFGVLSTILGTLFAIRQLKTKRMFLYSSIAQIGFIISGIALNSESGYISVFFFVLIYILTSILLWGQLIVFQRSESLIESIKEDYVSPLYISKFSQLITSTKLWVFIFIVTFFSIGGIPPFVGFLSKFVILESILEYKYNVIAVALIVVSSVSVYYYIRILKISFFETKKLMVSMKDYHKLIVKGFFMENYIMFAISFGLIFLFIYPNFAFLICLSAL